MNQATAAAFQDMIGDAQTSAAYKSVLKINERNGWFEPGEVDANTLALMTKVAARGLTEVFKFCLRGCEPFDAKKLQTAMRRFVAIAWLLHSEDLVGEDGEALKLSELGRLAQLDCTKCALSLQAKAFGNQFGFQSRVQKRRTSKGKRGTYSQAAKQGWEKRRARGFVCVNRRRAEPVTRGAPPS